MHRPRISKKLSATLKALTETRREFDELLDAIHDDVVVADSEGIVLKASPSFETLYGIRARDIIGRSVYDLEREGVFRPSATAVVLSTGERVTMTQKNGMNRSIVVTATPVKDGMGRIRKVVSFSRDITDYLTLQDEYTRLESILEEYEKEIDRLRSDTGHAKIIAKDASTRAIIETVRQVAPFDANVLLTGESGVGKNLFARLIHDLSPRNRAPFIEINCGAIPENLLESELFGYAAGAFTGADRKGKSGLISLANNGTLFLDEISELPPAMQVKLLKVLQSRTITKVGDIEEVEVDFRLVAATNSDLRKRIDEGLFREDLYYRLNVISIRIPPLRERKEDILPLTVAFAERMNAKYGKNKDFSKIRGHLERYRYPGNIRELENLIERLILTAQKRRITEADLPAELKTSAPAQSEETDLNLRAALMRLEKAYVEKAYRIARTTTGAAKLLGISQPSAVRKIQKHLKQPPSRNI